MTGTSYTRRRNHGLSAAAVAGAGLTASTGAAPQGGGGQAPAPTTNELRVFTYEGDETIDLFKAAIAKFDQQAGTKTAVNTLPGSGAAQYPDKLRTELLGGAGPDVWRIWGGELGGPFARAKQALDLAPYYEKFGWNNTINTTAIEGMTFDGMKAGVPFISLGMGGWYNKALFEKAGISAPPTSYEELEEANDKLLSAGTTPLGTGGKYGWHVMRLFEYLLETAAGPELHDKLLAMLERDQSGRTGGADPEGDGARTARLAEILDEHGWPTWDLVGEDGSEAAWAIAQHSDLDPAFQRRALELLRAAVGAGQASPGDLAYLTDRVATGAGEPQTYGTQVACTPDGPQPATPLADPAAVEELRAQAGLDPYTDYLAEMAAICAGE